MKEATRNIKYNPLPRDSLLLIREAQEAALAKGEKNATEIPSDLLSALPKKMSILPEGGNAKLTRFSIMPQEETKPKEKEPVPVQRQRRVSAYVQKYTLDTFISEVEAKEKRVDDMDFSGKDHALWHMGMAQGAMKSGFSEDVKYYRKKFQKWARGVLDREKDLLGFNVHDYGQMSPKFYARIIKGTSYETWARFRTAK